jgi:hypothetical protein
MDAVLNLINEVLHSTSDADLEKRLEVYQSLRLPSSPIEAEGSTRYALWITPGRETRYYVSRIQECSACYTTY